MLVGITLLSLIYAFLVRWRQNIWPAIAAHALFDAVQLLVIIPAALKLLESAGGRRPRPRPGVLLDSARGSSSAATHVRGTPLPSGRRQPFENIELVQVVLEDCLERLGVDEDTRHWVDLAVREAVANAIKHGNAQDPASRSTSTWASRGTSW